MKTKQKMILGVLVAVLFVGVSTYLIVQKDSPIQRTQYVSQWTRVQKDDLIQTLDKPGMVTAAQKYPVYFDKQLGSFNHFLVKEGDSIQSGTPLYEYTVTDAQESRNALQEKMDELQGNIDALESHIQELKQIQQAAEAEADARAEAEKNADKNGETKEIPDNSGEVKEALDNSGEAVETPVNNGEAEETSDQSEIKYSIKMEVSQKEYEKNQMENKLQSYQNQVQDLKDHSTVTVKSQHKGRIADVSEALKNPVVTVASDELSVKGELSENDLDTVKKGMETWVTSEHFSQRKGKIGEISRLPRENPSLYESSLYPFTVELKKKMKDEKPGFHVDLKIITAEAMNVVAIPEMLVKQQGKQKRVWILTDQGTVDKRIVKTGLKVDREEEIKKGLKKGDILVKEPEQIKAEGATFFTPLSWKSIKNVLQTVSDLNVEKNLLTGKEKG